VRLANFGSMCKNDSTVFFFFSWPSMQGVTGPPAVEDAFPRPTGNLLFLRLPERDRLFIREICVIVF